MPPLQCIVVTPARTVCEEPAEFVALSLYDGEIGIGPGHTPMIGRLGNGELRISAAEKTHRFYIEGGFVEVLGDTVSILTNRAIPAEDLDEAVANEQLVTAQARKANTPELMAVRDRAVSQSRAQLRVARRAAASSS
ncbi:MAG: ATP synthase F1 subunit epsilon [Thermoguttaceae bacterium]